eukprot:405640_1
MIILAIVLHITCTLISASSYGHHHHHHSQSYSASFESRMSMDHLDATNLNLRRDLLDHATGFFAGLKNMLLDGDLDEYKRFAVDLLDDSFVFPSDVTGNTFHSLDEFLDDDNGWHVNIIGTFDVVTTIMGANIIYRVIDSHPDTVEMEFDMRALFWRNTCPQSGLQGITEEEINIMTFVWCSQDRKWKIASFIGQGGKLDKLTCELCCPKGHELLWKFVNSRF